ncbi:kynureninase, partial [Bacillus thuringiensis]|nr:kynureninase [Bacillus thuringiensis]
MYKEPFQPTYEYALECDKHDELKDYQTEFYKKEGTIYLDGNSLGLL